MFQAVKQEVKCTEYNLDSYHIASYNVLTAISSLLY